MFGSGLPFKQKGKLACLSRRNRSGEGRCMQNARFSKTDLRPLNRTQIPLKISRISSLKISRIYPFDGFPIGVRLP
jgi:hypothetical protein